MTTRTVVRIVCMSALTCATPLDVYGQTGTISGVVVSRTTGEYLPYGIVRIEGTARSQFASDSGRFGFYDVPSGRHVVTVRRLGYRPQDVPVDVRDGATETLRIELDRVTVTLDNITVRAWPPCTRPGAPGADTDSTLAAIVSQIRLNAEQFRFLSQQYPYTWSSVITRRSRYRRDGLVHPEPGEVTRYESKSRRQYRPGQVIERRGGRSYFQIPNLIDVADSGFIAAHCWHYAGTESIEDAEHVRIDVVAFDSLKGPDVNGSFLLDRRTFQLHRSVLHLSKVPRNHSELLDMEVTTDFFEVLPSISIVSHVHSVQTIDPKRRSQISEAFEEHRTTGFRFLGRKPGEEERRP